jgi:hypothetical protein
MSTGKAEVGDRVAARFSDDKFGIGTLKMIVAKGWPYLVEYMDGCTAWACEVHKLADQDEPALVKEESAPNHNSLDVRLSKLEALDLADLEHRLSKVEGSLSRVKVNADIARLLALHPANDAPIVIGDRVWAIMPSGKYSGTVSAICRNLMPPRYQIACDIGGCDWSDKVTKM